MADVKYWMTGSMEQFTPRDLVAQLVEIEQAGFDGTGCSDHFQPWWEGGQSGHAWAFLGAAGQATESIPLGTGVTAPVFRHHPAVTAQAFMTLEQMFPGRVFLGIGSGEALNEVPLGMDWPSTPDQVRRMDEALQIITRLFDGEHLDFDGEHFRLKNAYLHTRAERRPPLYISAFGPKAAAVAGRYGDGLWTLADPEKVPGIIDAYRSAASDAGREPGEIILHTGVAWAEDDDALIEGSRMWRGTQPDEFYTDDWHEPAAMQEHAAAQVSDEQLRESFVISTDLDHHADRISEIERLGATVVCLQNISGADAHGTIRVYGETVLPALRG